MPAGRKPSPGFVQSRCNTWRLPACSCFSVVLEVAGSEFRVVRSGAVAHGRSCDFALGTWACFGGMVQRPWTVVCARVASVVFVPCYNACRSGFLRSGYFDGLSISSFACSAAALTCICCECLHRRWEPSGASCEHNGRSCCHVGLPVGRYEAPRSSIDCFCLARRHRKATSPRSPRSWLRGAVAVVVTGPTIACCDEEPTFDRSTTAITTTNCGCC